MALDALAPWAEPVLYTAEDLQSFADGEWRYELVQGRVVRMPPTNLEHSDICGILYLALRAHVDERRLGRVVMPETGFIVSDPGEPDTVLAPDLAFVREGRLPGQGSDTARVFPRLAPDLVVEVASPSQHRPEMAAKAQLWLSAGARVVWVVWPDVREIDVWLGGESAPSTLAGDDLLDGRDVLPGFALSVARLWATEV
jgi:Uma2 family endonuclease